MKRGLGFGAGVALQALGGTFSLAVARINPHFVLPHSNKKNDSSESSFLFERVTRIGLASSPWKGDILPVYYTRVS
ncbi:MAG: hypothetical protein UT13_C0001G0588 [Candidatus Pacebacteria bacterium GW2011_GWF2_38_9]|nr:MAG: hypothetical protein US20_C0022G0008 [Candidatus Pacebacteria bacterium GW2011_GWF1_36_5]KKQ88941.1 MAG: hypothetical protein UT13_C0001G0588 [Candidatus Pacebacteria bacterium GW2011_GWF2_38_9]